MNATTATAATATTATTVMDFMPMMGKKSSYTPALGGCLPRIEGSLYEWALAAEGLLRRGAAGVQSIVQRDEQNIAPLPGGGLHSAGGCFSPRSVLWDGGHWLYVSGATGEVTRFMVGASHRTLLAQKREEVVQWHDLTKRYPEEVRRAQLAAYNNPTPVPCGDKWTVTAQSWGCYDTHWFDRTR